MSSQKHTLKNVRQVAATNGVLAKNGQSSPAILIWIDLVLLPAEAFLKTWTLHFKWPQNQHLCTMLGTDPEGPQCLNPAPGL